MNNYSRPDEIATQSEIESNRRFDQKSKGLVKKAVGLGVGATGAGLASKLMPFLSEYIPVDLALKGISKVSPRTGEFLKKGMEKGLSIKDGFDYLKQNLQQKPDKKSEQQPAKDQRNIIQQYDPELHEYITQKIKGGTSPVEAGLKAMGHERFNKTIKQIEKDHKVKISQLIQSIYGMGENAMPQNTPQQPQQQPPQQPNQKKSDLIKAMQDMRQLMQNMKK
jgi:hypothetical protein